LNLVKIIEKSDMIPAFFAGILGHRTDYYNNKAVDYWTSIVEVVMTIGLSAFAQSNVF
jgi:hypothetical protein